MKKNIPGGKIPTHPAARIFEVLAIVVGAAMGLIVLFVIAGAVFCSPDKPDGSSPSVPSTPAPPNDSMAIGLVKNAFLVAHDGTVSDARIKDIVDGSKTLSKQINPNIWNVEKWSAVKGDDGKWLVSLHMTSIDPPTGGRSEETLAWRLDWEKKTIVPANEATKDMKVVMEGNKEPAKPHLPEDHVDTKGIVDPWQHVQWFNNPPKDIEKKAFGQFLTANVKGKTVLLWQEIVGHSWSIPKEYLKELFMVVDEGQRKYTTVEVSYFTDPLGLPKIAVYHVDRNGVVSTENREGDETKYARAFLEGNKADYPKVAPRVE